MSEQLPELNFYLLFSLPGGGWARKNQDQVIRARTKGQKVRARTKGSVVRDIRAANLAR